MLFSACSTSESTQSFECPKLDLTSISQDESSPQYFDEVAKLVEKTTQELVGQSEQVVETCAAEEGLQYRIAARDGEFFALTMDYIPTRINVEIAEKVVTKITVG